MCGKLRNNGANPKTHLHIFFDSFTHFCVHANPNLCTFYTNLSKRILDGIFFCVYTNRVHKLSMTSNKLSVPVLCFFFALQRRLLSPRSDFQQECDDFMEEILLFKMYKEKSRSFIQSRNRKIFYKMLSKAERRLCSRKIPRCALHMPTESAWAKFVPETIRL